MQIKLTATFAVALASLTPLLSAQDPVDQPPNPEVEATGEQPAPEADDATAPLGSQETTTEDASADQLDASADEDEPSAVEAEGEALEVPDEPEVSPGILERQEDEYFATCDYDKNGWISYREAESSLQLNRDGFAQYDANGDGQVTRDEFHIRYNELLKRIGLFGAPIPTGESGEVSGANPFEAVSAYPATSQEFVGNFDLNVDGKLDTSELGAAAEGLGFFGLDPAAVLAQFDADQSGFVEPGELTAIIQSLNSIEGLSPMPVASSIEELFGASVERPFFVGATPRPPFIRGPVIPFRRLDANNNGYIEVIDLEQLSVSAHTVIRPSAVLAGLDTNADGKLSPKELSAAFDG